MNYFKIVIIGAVALLCVAAQKDKGIQTAKPPPRPPRVVTAEPERVRRTTRVHRTIWPERIDDCDFNGLSCLRGFKTGVLCGRTAYYTYSTFRNMCEMEYVNCKDGHERWMVVHMGVCMGRKGKNAYDAPETYRSREDFLDNDYVVEEQV